ncbi:hypothetical protein DW352_14135 [Pseudolabrys taiwanensis]|uniref:Uncharacterized protein n=1 Tax=Pseudolabrys taiwanensis TaxID=331696 RepID=A0A345ZXA7_9HYPH|nr:hypothetical protein [Pseudolabrys taiwanensis]AXK81554.1 hypothetical protein DW352_14135 [Pseudolabrys taiwanensis]
MSNAYIVEVQSETAGIVVRDGRQYRFFASDRRFDALEGRDFNSLRAAEAAARDHAAKRRNSTRPNG